MKIVLISQYSPLVSNDSARGEQIRAHHLTLALKSAEHQVIHLSNSDLPTTESSRISCIEALDAEVVLSLSIEIAAGLGRLSVPLILDLYAPRIQESAFSSELSTASIHTLRALTAADIFLVSNPRQRWHWLGLLALAGVDTRTDPTILVPLSCDETQEASASRDTYFIAGGCHWPWQDPTHGLTLFLKALEAHPSARLRWLGSWPQHLPEALQSHPRLDCVGWLPYEAYKDQLSKASAAFDWYAPNPEREIALAFRHMDYLGSGLPILGYPNTALSDIIGDAGCLSSNITETVALWLSKPRLQTKARKAARKIASEYHWRHTTTSLCRWLENPQKRHHSPSLLNQWIEKSAILDQVQQQCGVLKIQLEQTQAEVIEKRTELARLTEQFQTQLSIIDRLSRSVDEVSGFKREAIQVLDTRIQQHAQSSDELSRENAILRADIEKKTAELSAMDALRARLENDLQHAHDALNAAKQRRPFWR